LITGCSSGLGLELASQAIAKGYRTVVTARKPAALQELEEHDRVLVLRLDVTQPFCVAAAVAAAEQRFGHIDVLVNHAGVGYFAAVEEGEPEAVRDMFDVNVFGLSAMLQAVLPGMRRRRQGCIVNVSSLGGLGAFPARGYYNAAKFAVEGLSEALRQEVEPIGIRVMSVEQLRVLSNHEPDHPSGHQPEDSVHAAQAILAAVQSGQPPHHLLLGAGAFEGALAKVDALRREILLSEAVARSTDIAAPEPVAAEAPEPVWQRTDHRRARAHIAQVPGH